MLLASISPIAEKYKALLAPHCERIEIAGSIRRKKAICNDIELVCIPKAEQFGLFGESDGHCAEFCSAVNSLEKVKGDPDGRYTQRLLLETDFQTGQRLKLDIFMTTELGWGYIFAIRTGSANFSSYLAREWVKKGYKGAGDHIKYRMDNTAVYFKEERELFNFLELDYKEPWDRL